MGLGMRMVNNTSFSLIRFWPIDMNSYLSQYCQLKGLVSAAEVAWLPKPLMELINGIAL
jgi:hypothetical protein